MLRQRGIPMKLPLRKANRLGCPLGSRNILPSLFQCPPFSRLDAGVTYLQHLQLFQPLLHELLHSSLPRLFLVFPEGVACSSFGVLAEVVGGELTALSQQRTILRALY